MKIQIIARTFLVGSLAVSAALAGVSLPVVATAGSAFTVDFNGYGGDPVQQLNGLTSQVTFSNFAFTDFTAANRTGITFDMLITNNSSGPITDSRVSVLGFRTTSNITSGGAPNAVSGVFDHVTLNGNMPVGVGQVEFCFSNVNCAGGGGGGVTLGHSDSAYASIFVAGTGVRQLQFDDAFVRYQSIAGAGRITSGVGAPVVPEPASYIVLGLGLAVVALRRKLRLCA